MNTAIAGDGASSSTASDDASGSWLTYLTPVTAVILALALVLVVRPSDQTAAGAAASRAPDRSLRPAAAAGPARAMSPAPDRDLPPPYIFVLVSAPEQMHSAYLSATVPEAFIDVRVIATPEDEMALTQLLLDMRAQMSSTMLPEPIVLDTRGYRRGQ